MAKNRNRAQASSGSDASAPEHKPESSTTIPGGVYKDAEGDGFHNAHGQPVDESGNVLEVQEEPSDEGGSQS